MTRTLLVNDRQSTGTGTRRGRMMFWLIRGSLLAAAVLILPGTVAAVGAPAGSGRLDERSGANPSAEFGVEVVGARLSAAGNIIDFRFRIIDADKATLLVDRTKRATLLHEKTGEELMVPSSPKIGSLRQTTKYGPPLEGRSYFILFSNRGRMVERGDRVTVVVGDYRSESLIVE